MKKNQYSPKIFFIHIPKTAGTSLRSYLADQFLAESIFPPFDWAGANKFLPCDVRRYKLFSGHFDIRLSILIGLDVKRISFFRDPVERTISAMRHALVDPRFCPKEVDIRQQTLMSLVDSERDLLRFVNIQAAVLSSSLGVGAAERNDDIGKKFDFTYDQLVPSLDVALENLYELDFVGLSEFMPESLSILSSRYGFFPTVLGPFRNESRGPDAYGLEKYFIDKIRDANYLDCELFEHVKRIFHGRVESVNRIEVEKSVINSRNRIAGVFSLEAPFDGWGFHEVESNGRGGHFRWSGPHLRSGVGVVLRSSKRYRGWIAYWMDPSNCATSLEVFINGAKCDAAPTQKNGGSRIEFCVDPQQGEADYLVEIEFRVDKVSSASFDARRLGFVLSGLGFDEISESDEQSEDGNLDDDLKFTGERFIPSEGGEIRLEHYHRYALALGLAKDKVVLDLACGEGYGCGVLSGVASKVIGVDCSELAIEHAKKKYGLPNTVFLVGDASEVPLADASVDLVVSFETIEHLLAQQEMISEIKRVLRSDGVLLISSPNRPVYSESSDNKNSFHVKELDLIELKSLLSGSFEKIDFYGQRLALGTVVHPLNGILPSYAGFSEEGNVISSGTVGLTDPVYYLAVCSNGNQPLDPLGASIFFPKSYDLISHYTGFAKWAKSLDVEIEKKNKSIFFLQEELGRLKKELDRSGASSEVTAPDEKMESLRRELLRADAQLQLLRELMGGAEGALTGSRIVG